MLHPHFIITLILFILFCSDFIVRGYEDENILYINSDELYYYQAIIIIIFMAIYILTWILSKGIVIVKKTEIFSKTPDKKIIVYFGLIAWCFLCIEIIKRLYFSDWSFGQVYIYTFGPRFGRPWASKMGALGDENFLFAFLGIIFPITGIIFGSLIIFKKGLKRLSSIIGYTLSLGIIIGDGSRTIALLVIILPTIYYLLYLRSIFKRILVSLLSICLIVIVATTIIKTRDIGLLNSSSVGFISAPVYHQDNSYYLALYAIHLASTTEERWEPLTFIGASVLNFMPRVIWPSKPTVGEDYWGNYKLPYVTITFVGELVALFGVPIGALFSVLIGVGCFFLLRYFYLNIKKPNGILLYGLIVLYLYMIMRSMLNITQFIYMPIFFLFIIKLIERYSSYKKRRVE